jgi:hypothetical protein
MEIFARCLTAMALSSVTVTGCAGQNASETPKEDTEEQRSVAETEPGAASPDATHTGTESDGNAETGGLSEATRQRLDDGGITSGLDVHIAKVGYLHDAEEGTIAIGDAEAWERYADSVSTVIYEGETETRAVPPGLGDYGTDFFAEGNTLLVRYHDLHTGSANPSVTSWTVDADSIVVEWDDGTIPGMLVTDDMSGFVTVVEVPKDVNVTQIRFSDSMR